MNREISRRSALRTIAGGTAALAAAALPSPAAAAEKPAVPALRGYIHPSVCRWCYEKIPLPDFCAAIRGMGLEAIDLVEVKDLPVVHEHGLRCAMLTGVPGGIPDGLNQPSNHDRIAAWMEQSIPAAARSGTPNIICFSGNRWGMADDAGLDHCAEGLKRFLPLAEKQRVTICLELLNSRVNHPDYMADHSAWGVELVKRVGSDRFKLLYDIYHMQIMEGDLIATIRTHADCIAHYHTGGVPGRGEIDATQEINYPAVMQAILAAGFRGFVAQEFVPKKPDALASLREGVLICDVEPIHG
ncbi:MAG: TIM barrel protein [Verrucomicrobiota bacterium]